jgi:hypothetical protein
LLILMSIPFPALAEKRVALLIGNGAYMKVPKLAPELSNTETVCLNGARGYAERHRRRWFRSTGAQRKELGSSSTSFAQHPRGSELLSAGAEIER